MDSLFKNLFVRAGKHTTVPEVHHDYRKLSRVYKKRVYILCIGYWTLNKY